jgi:hypothetical protein
MPILPYLNSGWSCTSTVIDNKIHVIGLSASEAFHLIYDPKTDSWSSGALKGTAYASTAATTGDNAPKRMYVFSADYTIWQLNPPSITTMIYDPTSDSWTIGTSMPTERANVGVAVVKDQLYVIGGETLEVGMNSVPSAANEQYTPDGYHSTDDITTPADIIKPPISVLSTENTLVLVACGVLIAVTMIIVYFAKLKNR